MFELERISKDAIPAALEKAMRYRLLNEPLQSESICLDILEVEPENQQALVTLLLALSDHFTSNTPVDLSRARSLLSRLADEYERAYYAGILAERRAAALIQQGQAGRGHVAYNLLREAMDWYQQARAIAPPDVDDAILRWNTCVRMIKQNPLVTPAPDDPSEHMLE